MPKTATIQRTTTRQAPRAVTRRRVLATRRVRTRRERSVLVPAMAVFFSALACAWVLSSVLGNIALEKERRQRLFMAERIQVVGAEIERLEREVNLSAGADAVETFVASGHWMLSTEPNGPVVPASVNPQPGESRVVARR